jgi:hypothetical protein
VPTELMLQVENWTVIDSYHVGASFLLCAFYPYSFCASSFCHCGDSFLNDASSDRVSMTYTMSLTMNCCCYHICDHADASLFYVAWMVGQEMGDAVDLFLCSLQD